jgi:hypothetical protein
MLAIGVSTSKLASVVPDRSLEVCLSDLVDLISLKCFCIANQFNFI